MEPMEYDFSDRAGSTQEIWELFDYTDRPETQKHHSGTIRAAAAFMITELPDGLELCTGLNKLLEARDCFDAASVSQ